MAMANFIFTPLATVLAWLTFLPLKYETMVINLLGSLKYSALEIKNFSWIWVALWYIILMRAIIFLKIKDRTDNDLNAELEYSPKPRYSLWHIVGGKK